MDKFLQYLPVVFKYAGVIKQVLDAARSNEDVIAMLKAQAGPIFSILEEYGKMMFPQAAETIHAIGGAISADHNVTGWIQEGVNIIVSPNPPLVVDGIYGKLTRDGVMALQTKLGLRIDGIAGRITQAAIDAWFASQQASVAPKVT